MNRSEAAEARAAAVRARADRPSQRRSTAEPGTGARVSVRLQGLRLERSQGDSGPLVFEGYASVTESPYQMYDFFGPYDELVSQGAFGATLARADLDVPFVLQHDDLRRIARTTNGSLNLREDDHGLNVRAELDPDDADVAYIAPKLRSGLIDEMSFKFRIDSGQWSPDYTEYRINAVDIHRGDVSIVAYGANPATKGSGLADSSSAKELSARSKKYLEPDPREKRRSI
jgi:hypothetical protein